MLCLVRRRWLFQIDGDDGDDDDDDNVDDDDDDDDVDDDDHEESENLRLNCFKNYLTSHVIRDTSHVTHHIHTFLKL
jgi:hypothetical protein